MWQFRFRMKAPLSVVEERFREREELDLMVRGGWTVGDDYLGTELFGWEVSEWEKAAGEYELYYACYDEGMDSCEYIHILNGAAVRAYQVFQGVLDTDQGEEPPFSGWKDVAARMREWLR